MKGYWHADRIETSTLRGFPDLVFSTETKTGFIELKAIKERPKRPTSKLGINLSPLQVAWLKKRREYAGSNCFVFVKIQASKEYLLFDAKYADRLNDATNENMPGLIKRWHYQIDPVELKQILDVRWA